MIDETYFEKIDSNIKAYILGLLVFNIQSIQFDEANKAKSLDVFMQTNDMVYKDGINTLETELRKISDTANIHNINIQNQKIITDICGHLGVETLYSENKAHNEVDITYILNNITKEYGVEILKAYIDKYGAVIPRNTHAQAHLPLISLNDKCVIKFTSESNQTAFANFFGIPYATTNDDNIFILQYTNVNAIDLMGKFYTNTSMIYSNTLFTFFETILGGERPHLKYVKVTDDAVVPTKANYSDVGYDLTATGICKKFNANTVLCNTGIKLDIPTSYYVEIVPRSSLIKSGYMLANSIGIIDCSYKGELMIALIKVDPDAPELVFPYKCCQLIMKKQIFPRMEETTELEMSSRDQGGFGSSG